MTFVESVNQLAEAAKGLEEFNVIAVDAYHQQIKIHLLYEDFEKLAEGQTVEYKPHSSENPFKASFQINACEIFALLNREQAKQLGLIPDTCLVCGNKKETAEAVN